MNKTCRSIAQYPLRVYASSAGLVQGKPLICGGIYRGFHRRLTPCYIYKPSTNSWPFLAYLRTYRLMSAGIGMLGGVWITGGWNGRESVKSTEFVFENGTVIQGPDLPSARDGHCMVDLLDGRIILTGGSPTWNEVLIYHQSNRSFVQGPPLLVGRKFHACTMFHSSTHGLQPVILVAGGRTGSARGAATYSVEVLLLSNTLVAWKKSEYEDI